MPLFILTLKFSTCYAAFNALNLIIPTNFLMKSFSQTNFESNSCQLWSLVLWISHSFLCPAKTSRLMCKKWGSFAIFRTGGTSLLMSQWEHSDWAALLWMLHVMSLFVLCKRKYLFLDKPRQTFPLPFLFGMVDFQSSHFWNILFPVPRETRWRAVLPDKKLAVFLHYRVALFSLCYIYTRGKKKKVGKSFPSSKREK